VKISHYELIERIGRDGAAEIYRARDLRLERDVAVKLLRPEELQRPAARDLFKREARISSLVTHPHICAVHDSGEEDGQPFLVCELLEGRALDEVMAAGPLPLGRLLDIALQITDAIAAAHRRNIVHGNLKPSNVFVTTDGHVKLLELGAATAALGDAPPPRADSASRTTSVESRRALPPTTGDLIHPYVAPEQIAGTGADHRADLFSIGALLYEMATGRRAFEGQTPSRMAASVTGQQPPAARRVNRRVPRALDAMIRRALEKDPARRYQSAAQLLDDLRRVRRAHDVQDSAARTWARRLRLAAPAAIVVLAAGGIWVTGAALGWWRAAAGDGLQRSAVLVGHIANGTADPDFDDTLREAVTVYLGQSPYLEVVSDERIDAALQRMGRETGTRMTHDIAAEVCQRLGLQAMLEGSVSAVGRATVIALVATDCATGATIERRQVEVERKEDVLRAMGPLSESIREALGESRASLARHNVPIEEATTPSLDALKAYTQAAARRAAGAEMEAVPFLERAIALDPRFALAHTTLSTLYGGLGETGRSEAYARRAYENRGHVSERERLFITYQYHDRSTGDQIKARETLEVWKRTYPRDYRPVNALAVLLNRLGEYDRAAAEAEEAIRRNPAHAFPYSNLAYAHRGAGRYAEARKAAESTVARGIETVPTRRLLYQLAELRGDRAQAQEQLDWAARSRRGFDIVGARAQVAAYRGRMTEARALYRQTIASAREQGFTQVASGYAAQAALTDALYGNEREALEQAREVLDPATPYEPQLRAAAALALAGDTATAEALLRRLRGVRPEDTLLHAAYVPVTQAAVLLRRDRPAEAVEALRAAVRYERGLVAALVPACLRGEGRLRSGLIAEAIAEFTAVLDHRGADPFSPVIPLSQLGLARAHARAGNVEASTKAYETLLAQWSGGDPDLPILRMARAERAALGGM
jgi:tetratricopeptide (TPR) repeat protein